MQTTPQPAELLAELYARSLIVADLDGPQIEALASGLFPLFDESTTAQSFLAYCQGQATVEAALVCLAIAELASGIDPHLSAQATEAAAALDVALPPSAAQIGASVLSTAWMVEAPFGRSIVLGFDNAAEMPQSEADDEAESVDSSHSILVEVGQSGVLEDLQLTGPSQSLVDEVATGDDRVSVRELEPADAVAQIVAAWPSADRSGDAAYGPGIASNQQFVRSRLREVTGELLDLIAVVVPTVDISRGLSAAELAEANRAALSTLRAAVGTVEAAATGSAATVAEIWAGVIRGDEGELSSRERDGLLWLEWADWLGVGIGLLRAGEGAEVSGISFVDLVNRCPEVSSTIDKRDRSYAEWAFEVALDLLTDAGAVDNGKLTPVGVRAVGPAMQLAWGGSSTGRSSG